MCQALGELLGLLPHFTGRQRRLSEVTSLTQGLAEPGPKPRSVDFKEMPRRQTRTHCFTHSTHMLSRHDVPGIRRRIALNQGPH